MKENNINNNARNRFEEDELKREMGKDVASPAIPRRPGSRKAVEEGIISGSHGEVHGEIPVYDIGDVE